MTGTQRSLHTCEVHSGTLPFPVRCTTEATATFKGWKVCPMHLSRCENGLVNVSPKEATHAD